MFLIVITSRVAYIASAQCRVPGVERRRQRNYMRCRIACPTSYICWQTPLWPWIAVSKRWAPVPLNRPLVWYVCDNDTILLLNFSIVVPKRRTCIRKRLNKWHVYVNNYVLLYKLIMMTREIYTLFVISSINICNFHLQYADLLQPLNLSNMIRITF